MIDYAVARRQARKATAKEAGYTAHAMNKNERCDKCIYFIQPGGRPCQLVDTSVAPGGWCEFFHAL
jgi:hypothetical protein